jgi:hypothetical protein
MCEIPSNVILAKQFAQHFDGFSIGSNDLTQLTLGVDRDSGELADLFDEQDEAVKWMIRRVITEAVKAGAKIGICGQAPRRPSGVREVPGGLRHRQHLRQPGQLRRCEEEGRRGGRTPLSGRLRQGRFRGAHCRAHLTMRARLLLMAPAPPRRTAALSAGHPARRSPRPEGNAQCGFSPLQLEQSGRIPPHPFG